MDAQLCRVDQVGTPQSADDYQYPWMSQMYEKQVRNHQQHHADGKLDEAEYHHACRALNAFVDSVSCLTDVQRKELRSEIRKICG